MSRLTAAQVIALGEYLEPDFDPSSLTIAQLLGVFGYHNVNYPSQYTKPKLVQLFNDEIKTNASKLRRQRIKRENSQASDDGKPDVDCDGECHIPNELTTRADDEGES